jgi:tRNA (cmo5U34)-methyltransferase
MELKNGFDFNKIKDFDRHIHLSIPNYDSLIEQINGFAKYFVDEYSTVYDLGCSTGKFLKSLDKRENVHYIGIDNSTLLPASDNYIDFVKADLRDYEFNEKASFITSIFTLQFLPREERTMLLNKVKDILLDYGAFIVCEKTYSANPIMEDITTSLYYEFKQTNFSAKEILNKERELRYNMKRLTLKDILNELRFIGEPEIFWRSFNFVGVIVIKAGERKCNENSF